MASLPKGTSRYRRSHEVSLCIVCWTLASESHLVLPEGFVVYFLCKYIKSIGCYLARPKLLPIVVPPHEHPGAFIVRAMRDWSTGPGEWEIGRLSTFQPLKATLLCDTPCMNNIELVEGSIIFQINTLFDSDILTIAILSGKLYPNAFYLADWPGRTGPCRCFHISITTIQHIPQNIRNSKKQMCGPIARCSHLAKPLWRNSTMLEAS